MGWVGGSKFAEREIGNLANQNGPGTNRPFKFPILLPRLQHDDAARKLEPLHVHHVEFRSYGGSDSESNLVPLCPTCHVTLHESRRSGRPFLSDDELRAAWELWKDLGTAVGPVRIGTPPWVARCEVRLDIYGLSTLVDLDDRINYLDFRDELIARVIAPIASADQHFPFDSAHPAFWGLNLDSHIDERRDTVRAVAVVDRVPAITFTARVVHMLTRTGNRYPMRDPSQRGL